MPGHNYLGPGTHVITNILRRVAPVNHADAKALLHDIDYLTKGDKFESDIHAIIDQDGSMSDLVLRLGLQSRMAIDLVLKLLSQQHQFLPNMELNFSSDIVTPQQQLVLGVLADDNIHLNQPLSVNHSHNILNDMNKGFATQITNNEELRDVYELLLEIGPESMASIAREHLNKKNSLNLSLSGTPTVNSDINGFVLTDL